MVTTHNELLREIQKSEKDLKEYVKDKIRDLHDDLKENHFSAVLDAIAGIQAGDTSAIMEAIMALQAGLDRLGVVTAKLVVDGQTSQTKIEAGLAEIERLIQQGSADKTELDALKVTVGAADTTLDTHVTNLEALDAAVADPNQPALDPNAPVA